MKKGGGFVGNGDSEERREKDLSNRGEKWYGDVDRIMRR